MSYQNLRPAVAACAAALVLSGCGGGSGSSTPPDPIAGQNGAVGYQGAFANVKSAPTDAPAVTGLAELVVGKSQTKVSVTATGFDITAVYGAYVDTDTCSAADPGGGHYKFNPSGPDASPNVMRVDLVFQEDSHGVKQKGVDGEKTFDGVAGPQAKSVVIYQTRKPRFHEDDPNPPKIACADLKPETS
ncbi:MAG TPA: hypothetical protein VHV82_02670 [Sporichthyaceae bacterium]|jgi:hypothetical protein|nr:hypothetical protein [Sporichthyaceae bacterium]